MNIVNRATTIDSESVFIEADNLQDVKAMRSLLQQGSWTKIQNHFFPFAKEQELNIHKVTNSLINKHQHSLNFRNKTLLRQVLKSNDEGQLDSNDLKNLHESTSGNPSSDNDICQYLAINEEIDFDGVCHPK